MKNSDKSVEETNTNAQFKKKEIDYDKLLYLLRSIIRKRAHIKAFGRPNVLNNILKKHIKNFDKPNCIDNINIPASLLRSENKSILHTIFKINSDENGPYVIPSIIDHWTSIDNLKSIIRSKAFYGNAQLKKNGDTFDKNALAAIDKLNLDGNVICFCPGGYVDPIAITNKYSQSLRIRIDLSKTSTRGKYNQFFKATDLAVKDYQCKVQLTNNLKMEVKKQSTAFLQIKFVLGSKAREIFIYNNQCVFYGSLLAINKYALLLPFIALETELDVNTDTFASEFYKELTSLDEGDLRKVLIVLAQHITLFSELNFNGTLQISQNSIHDIHFVKDNVTYELSRLSGQAYINALEEISSSSLLLDIPQKSEVICETKEGLLFMYGQKISNLSGEMFGHALFKETDARNLSSTQFNNGYYETRPGNRK